MDFKELKKLIGENGRCVIIENDKPAYVVMTTKEFLDLHEKQVADPVITPVVEEKLKPTELLSKKEGTASFIHADDNSVVQLQDIMFDDFSIDELPE